MTGAPTTPDRPADPSARTLRDLDRAHVWHPYGPMPGRTAPLVVRSAEVGETWRWCFVDERVG